MYRDQGLGFRAMLLILSREYGNIHIKKGLGFRVLGLSYWFLVGNMGLYSIGIRV